MLIEANIRKMLVDGDQWASWQGYHIPASEDYFVIWTPIGTAMHWKPGTWFAHKHQLSYFWPNEWYTLHAGYNERGKCISVYCDIVLPDADYTNTTQELIYTDLYIDVVVEEDFSVYTKDQEVFERVAKEYPIVEQSRQKSFEALDGLAEHAKQWSGPFEIIPRQLPRTDFEALNPEEAGKILQDLA